MMKRLILSLALVYALSFNSYKANTQNINIPKESIEDLESIIIQNSLPRNCDSYHEDNALRYSISAYKNKAGYLIIDLEKKLLRFRLDMPIPYVGRFLNFIFGDLNIKEDVLFLKENDSTYIEEKDDETFVYNLRDGKWFLESYTGDNKENQRKVGDSFYGEPIIDLLNKRFLGEKIEYITTFLLGRDHKSPMPKEENIFGYELLKFDMNKFKVFEDNKWISLMDTEDVLFEEVVAIFCDNKPVFAIGKINPSLLFGLFSSQVRMIREDLRY